MNNNDPLPPNEIAGNARRDSKRTSNTAGPSPSKIPKIRVQIEKRVIPAKAPRDPNEYRVIKLSNGLTVALISRKQSQNHGSVDASSYFSSSFWDTYLGQSKVECHFLPSGPFPVERLPFLSGNDSTNGVPSTILQRTCAIPPDQTSIAMVVNVGGLDDPYEFQGLAHFTEHMVHYGTEKFPAEDAVSLVVANFGTYNATTRPHTTSYYNEVPDRILDRNLELFSSMITSPLFSLNVINREVNAVDNEFYLRLPFWRKLLLQTHVCVKSEKHPLARFICGTLETLGGGKNGGKVESEMKKFHKKNYVASAMTLSINSTKSIEELEALALEHFSDIPQGNRTLFSHSQPDTSEKLVFGESQHVYLEGVASGAYLSLLWHLPAHDWLNDRKQRVIPLITNMLSDTSNSSLDSHLRSKELIWALQPVITTTLYASFVEILFQLTEKGSQNTEEIKAATLEYLEVLQNRTSENDMRRLFEEMRVLNLKEYHYGNQMTTLETTKDLAMRLQYIDNEADVLSSESWEDAKFNFKSIQAALAMLKEDTLIVVEVLHKDVNIEDKGKVQVAPFSGARYVVRETKKNGNSGGKKQVGSARGNTNFAFVPKNKYLSLDLETMTNARSSRVNEGGDAGSEEYIMRRPENVGDITPQNLTWRSKYDLAGQAIPKIQGVHHGHSATGHDPFDCSIVVQLISPRVRYATTMNRALFILWACAIDLKVRDFSSEIFAAGFRFGIVPFSMGLKIFVGGFPRHIDQVLCKIIANVFEEPITPTVFSLAKQRLYMIWQIHLSTGEQVSSSLFNCILFEEADMSSVDIFGPLQEATLEDLNLIVEVFKHSAFAFVELVGNLPIRTFAIVAEHLDKMPFAPRIDNNPSLYNSHFSAMLPDLYSPGERCVRVKFVESIEYTTTVSNLYILGPYGSNQRQADCFAAAIYFMNCQAFMNLRTEQQLGYVVFARKYLPQQLKVPMMMMSVTVMSTAKKYTPCELDQKIDQFLAEYGTYIEKLNPELYQLMWDMTCTPAEAVVPQKEVTAWFKERFSKDFGKRDIKMKCALAGIKKVSLQIQPGNKHAQSKDCLCQICQSIDKNGWKPGSIQGSKFMYATGSGITKDYFIRLPKF